MKEIIFWDLAQEMQFDPLDGVEAQSSEHAGGHRALAELTTELPCIP